jgi:hypothetical protein
MRMHEIALTRRRRPRLSWWCVVGVLTGLGFGFAAPGGREEPIRGVIISCQTWGHEWGSDAMVQAMKEVQALGANWIQIHPYGGIDREGNVQMSRLPEDGSAPEWLARPIREAHALGLKIAVVPHVAGWRAGWSWRGDITFEREEQWARFFASYQAWITALARLCRDADAFSVGSELDRLIPGREAEWRAIIAAVRAQTRAPLTYGANWSDYRAVPFWDALDAIGISAYFPLVEHANPPVAAELDAAWVRLRRELSEYAADKKRRVVFLELGYDSTATAALTPWVSGRGKPPAPELQVLCLDRALAAVNDDQELHGAFLWKWFPGEPRRADYRLQDPAMQAVMKKYWGVRGAAAVASSSAEATSLNRQDRGQTR